MVNHFSEILINKYTTVKSALKQLDTTAGKILFVVNESNKLFGSISDGDIRRWILSDGDLNTETEIICFKETFFVNDGYDIDFVKMEMARREISCVPVLNENNEIQDVLMWSDLFYDKENQSAKGSINAEIVIMAGGKGTRLEPFTKILPKPLIPIGNKTILEIIIEKFLPYNVNHFYISVNHKAQIIKSYFEELKPEYKITYLHERKPLGTIGAIKQLEEKINNNIIITNCDIIIETDYFDLLKHHIDVNNDITLVASVMHYNIPYGVCEVSNGGTLVNINEKPEYDLLVNTGMYVMKSSILQHIPQNEFFHITDLINKIKNTHKIGIYPISKKSWIDTGEWNEYKKAVNFFETLK